MVEPISLVRSSAGRRAGRPGGTAAGMAVRGGGGGGAAFIARPLRALGGAPFLAVMEISLGAFDLRRGCSSFCALEMVFAASPAVPHLERRAGGEPASARRSRSFPWPSRSSPGPARSPPCSSSSARCAWPPRPGAHSSSARGHGRGARHRSGADAARRSGPVGSWAVPGVPTSPDRLLGVVLRGAGGAVPVDRRAAHGILQSVRRWNGFALPVSIARMLAAAGPSISCALKARPGEAEVRARPDARPGLDRIVGRCRAAAARN